MDDLTPQLGYRFEVFRSRSCGCGISVIQITKDVVRTRSVSRPRDARPRACGCGTRPLVAAALGPRVVNPALLPKPLPRSENIREIRRSGRFGLVTVVYGSAPLGMSGYSMLFERRGDEWSFLCVVKMWIS